MIQITANTQPAIDKLNKLAVAMQPENVDKVIEQCALEVLSMLVTLTKEAIGTRPDGNRWNLQKPENKWIIRKPRPGERILANPDKVMKFLDAGTRAHGPVSKKWLYIPLTRRAAAGWNPSLIRRQIKNGVLIPGDYMLVKSVKGIEGRHITDKVRSWAKRRLLTLMKEYIRSVIA